MPFIIIVELLRSCMMGKKEELESRGVRKIQVDHRPKHQ
jgi:hypothetical protein